MYEEYEGKEEEEGKQKEEEKVNLLRMGLR